MNVTSSCHHKRTNKPYRPSFFYQLTVDGDLFRVDNDKWREFGVSIIIYKKLHDGRLALTIWQQHTTAVAKQWLLNLSVVFLALGENQMKKWGISEMGVKYSNISLIPRKNKRILLVVIYSRLQFSHKNFTKPYFRVMSL